MSKLYGQKGKKGMVRNRAIRLSRRAWLKLGAGAVLSGLAAAGYKSGLIWHVIATEAERAQEIAKAIILRYAVDKNDPWMLAHGVRALGRTFSLPDGTNVVDYICTRYAAEQVIGGRRYVLFPSSVEVHQNSFLKTFVEAQVSMEQRLIAGGNNYTLSDLFESAKKLFVFDNSLKFIGQNLAWSLIAFSNLIRPEESTWENAYGDKIFLKDVISAAFRAWEEATEPLKDAMRRGAEVVDRSRVKLFTCFGGHILYAMASCVKNGYVENNNPSRFKEQMALLLYRLRAESNAIEAEYRALERNLRAPQQQVKEHKLRTKLKFLGHSFEVLNFARKHNLFVPDSGQYKLWSDGERALHRLIFELNELDLDAIKRRDPYFLSQLIGDLCHAYHGLRLASAYDRAP